MINFIAADGTVILHFARTEAAAKKMSRAGLRYNIRDAYAAIAAMPNGKKAGYYADEISVLGMELRSRKAAAAYEADRDRRMDRKPENLTAAERAVKAATPD